MRFLQSSLISCTFLVLLGHSFLFLSSLRGNFRPLPKFPSICKFPFLREFFFLFRSSDFSIMCHFLLLIMGMAHFLCQTLSLCNFCIFSRSVFVFIFLLQFWQSLMSMYIKWLIFSCDLWSLYPTVHFLVMLLSSIIAITNSNSYSTSSWKIPYWIFN